MDYRADRGRRDDHPVRGAAGEALAFADGQLGNPVEIDLVPGVEVRDSSTSVRIESIGQASSGSADVTARSPSEARCRRSDINRLGIGVVEVEGETTADLLSQRGLERVVVRFADRTPGKHAGRLVVEVISRLPGKAGASGGGTKIVRIALVVPQAAIQINIADPHDLVACIREKRIVIEVVNGLDEAGVARSRADPGKVAETLICIGPRLERRQHVVPIGGSWTDAAIVD